LPFDFQRPVELRDADLECDHRSQLDDFVVVEVPPHVPENVIGDRISQRDRFAVGQRGAFTLGKQNRLRGVGECAQFLNGNAMGSAPGRVQLDSKAASDERRNFQINQIH